MNAILKTGISTITALLFLGTLPAFGQSYSKAEWCRVKMDSTYDGHKGKVTKVIDKHQATSPALLKTAGKCKKDLNSAKLNDFTTKIMMNYAAQRLSRELKDPQAGADMAIANFKTKKASIKAGDITPLDIISLFPMDNQLILFDLKGTHLRELLKSLSKKSAISSFDRTTIEDERLYKIIATDFLFREDECGDILEYAENVKTTNMFLSNVIVQHIQRIARKGETL